MPSATWNIRGKVKPRARKGMRTMVPPVRTLVRKVAMLSGLRDSNGWRALRLWRMARTPRARPTTIRAAGPRPSPPGVLIRSRPQMKDPRAAPVSQNPGQSKGRGSEAFRSGM